jgi:hypothetical protein
MLFNLNPQLHLGELQSSTSATSGGRTYNDDELVSPPTVNSRPAVGTGEGERRMGPTVSYWRPPFHSSISLPEPFHTAAAAADFSAMFRRPKETFYEENDGDVERDVTDENPMTSAELTQQLLLAAYGNGSGQHRRADGRSLSLNVGHFRQNPANSLLVQPSSSPASSSSVVQQQQQQQLQQQQQVSAAGGNAGPARYKTELCRPFEEHGTCRYGVKCQFAHGRAELRSVARHPKYKTDLCRTFHTTGLCPYGPRCHFIHNEDERNTLIVDSVADPAATGCGIKQKLQPQHQQQLKVQAVAAHRRQHLQPQRSIQTNEENFDDSISSAAYVEEAAAPADLVGMQRQLCGCRRLERQRSSLPSSTASAAGMSEFCHQTSWDSGTTPAGRAGPSTLVRRVSVADPCAVRANHRYQPQQQQPTPSPLMALIEAGLLSPRPTAATDYQVTASTMSSGTVQDHSWGSGVDAGGALMTGCGGARSIGSTGDSFSSSASSVSGSPSPSPTAGLYLRGAAGEDASFVWQPQVSTTTQHQQQFSDVGFVNWSTTPARTTPPPPPGLPEPPAAPATVTTNGSGERLVDELFSRLEPEKLNDLIRQLLLSIEVHGPTTSPAVAPTDTAIQTAASWSKLPYELLHNATAVQTVNTCW